MYFGDHMLPGTIAQKLGVRLEYISRLVAADSRYKSEKIYRARQSENRRRTYMRDFMREKRSARPIELALPNSGSLRREHELAVIELSREKYY
jgi:hypothetical protein